MHFTFFPPTLIVEINNNNNKNECFCSVNSLKTKNKKASSKHFMKNMMKDVGVRGQRKKEI